MASLAWPELWPDLSGLGPTENNGSDARAALLKVNAEMFVSAPARDREVIETFEALAMGFLPRADEATLAEIARILAPCEDTPASILDHVMSRSPRARDIVLSHRALLPPAIDNGQLATFDGRLQLASRSSLDARTIDRLLVMHESEVENALAANPGLSVAASGFEELLRRARSRTTLASILLDRRDLTLDNEAALYLAAGPERAALIRDKLTASAAVQRTMPPFKLTEHDVGAFFAASQQGDVGELENLLSTAFGFPAATDWRILQIGRHPLLALALKALGFVEKEATRVFLTLHPALSHSLSTVTGLARIVRDVPRPVALVLVEAILGVRAVPPR